MEAMEKNASYFFSMILWLLKDGHSSTKDYFRAAKKDTVKRVHLCWVKRIL